MRRLKRLAEAYSLCGVVCLLACHPTTTVRLRVSNPSTVPVVVDLTSVDDANHPLRSDSRRLAAAAPQTDAEGKNVIGPDGQPLLTPSVALIEWSGVRRLSRLKLEYRPESSTTRFPVGAPLTVHDSREPFVKEASIGNLRLYDQAASEATILQLASELGGGASALLAERLVDVLPLMGSVVVASFKMDANGAEAAQVHGSVHLQDVKYEHAPATQLRSTATTDRQVMVKAASAVPVYGSLATQMDAGDVCHLAWSINHTPVLNSSFDLAAALESATLAQLKSLRNLLTAYPDSTIATVAKLHVVESASFGVTRGHVVQDNEQAALASVFTDDSAYSFGLNDESYVSLPSMVVNVWYNKEVDRASTMTLLERLIKNKSLSMPSSTSLNGLKDAVRNGLAPNEYNDTTMTREALKQPMM